MPTTTPTALITGASRGLGLALARALARDGWALIIDARGANALDAARQELSALTPVVAIPGDVMDPAHRQDLADAAHDAGGLDAIINNASILGPSPQPALLDYPLDVLEEVYRANVIAPLGVLQAVRPFLKPGARILNITSDAGVEPYEGWGGYGSSKAALEQLSHILAAELPEYRVYWVDPGDMRTDLHQQAFPGEDISDRPLPEVSVPGLLALLTGDLPSGRYKAREVTTSSADSVSVTDANTADDPDDDPESTTGHIRTQMQQEAFPGEDISDRPLPETSVPGLLTLLTGDLPSGRYKARELDPREEAAETPHAAVHELRVALTVNDFNQAVAAYRDGFGLPIVKEWDTPEGRGMILAAGRATLELLDEADAAYTDSVEAGARVSGTVRLAVEVDDVRAAATSLIAHGAAAVGEPVLTSWGNPSQRVRGPDGMQITLFQTPAS